MTCNSQLEVGENLRNSETQKLINKLRKSSETVQIKKVPLPRSENLENEENVTKSTLKYIN